MKSTIVRLSVLGIATLGFTASTVLSHSQKLSSHATATHVNISCPNMPAPSCPYNSGGVGCW